MYKNIACKNPINKNTVCDFLKENITFKIIHLNIVLNYLNYCLQFITELSIKYYIIFMYINVYFNTIH